MAEQSVPGWEVRMSGTHLVPYFYNAETKTSTWEKPLPDDEIKKLPGAHLLVQPGQIRASHLLIKHKDSRRAVSWREKNITRTQEEATQILQGYQEKITAAPDKAKMFGELAKAYSDCSSHDKNGDLGMFRRGMMQKPFQEAAFALNVGEISEIVSTDSGVHLIMRTE